MSFLPSLNIAASGMTAQQRRLATITENIVNRETTRTEDGGPYRRQLSVFREITSDNRFSRLLQHSRSARAQQRFNNALPLGGVMISEIIECETDLIPVYDPRHPDADEQGYVWMPNVNNTTEMIDAMAATRSYSSALAAFEAMRSMAQQALELGR